MSNSKSDQTVTGNPKAIKVTFQCQTSKKSHPSKGPSASVIDKPQRAIFILKPNFKKLTTEKIPK